MIPDLLFALGFVVGFTSILLGFTALDLLVRIERRRFRHAWVKDGRPIGLWSASPTDWLMGGLWRSTVGLKWVLRTPAWVRGDKRAERILLLARVGFLIAVVALPVAAVGALLQ